MDEDFRWKQRLSNYKKAFLQLTLFINKPELNVLEQQGLIQCFEYTFELAWKTMKDWLNWQGAEANSPRAAIQHAFQGNLIENGHVWLDALKSEILWLMPMMRQSPPRQKNWSAMSITPY